MNKKRTFTVSNMIPFLQNSDFENLVHVYMFMCMYNCMLFISIDKSMKGLQVIKMSYLVWSSGKETKPNPSTSLLVAISVSAPVSLTRTCSCIHEW